MRQRICAFVSDTKGQILVRCVSDTQSNNYRYNNVLINSGESSTEMGQEFQLEETYVNVLQSVRVKVLWTSTNTRLYGLPTYSTYSTTVVSHHYELE